MTRLKFYYRLLLVARSPALVVEGESHFQQCWQSTREDTTCQVYKCFENTKHKIAHQCQSQQSMAAKHTVVAADQRSVRDGVPAPRRMRRAQYPQRQEQTDKVNDKDAGYRTLYTKYWKLLSHIHLSGSGRTQPRQCRVGGSQAGQDSRGGHSYCLPEYFSRPAQATRGRQAASLQSRLYLKVPVVEIGRWFLLVRGPKLVRGASGSKLVTLQRVVPTNRLHQDASNHPQFAIVV